VFLCFILQPQLAAMKKGITLISILIISLFVFAQEKGAIVAGPMLGFVELRTAKIWCEVSPQTQKGFYFLLENWYNFIVKNHSIQR
jgi:hypothetical protein